MEREEPNGYMDKILEVLEHRSALRRHDGTYVDPRLKKVATMPLETCFSIFNDKHIKEASKICKLLRGVETFDDFILLAKQLSTIANDDMFLYVFYTTVLHRNDCRNVIMPPIEECAPHWFFASETIHEAIQLSMQNPDDNHIVINRKTAESSDPESHLAYFREDIGLNSHHWSWHVVFPSIWDEKDIMKDRKGELFYYMHEQMVARYDCERMSNGMKRVTPLSEFREPLEAYFSHLTCQTIGVHLGSRPEGLVLQDIPNVTVQDLELWRGRIYDAIDQKYVQDVNGTRTSLDNQEGINILGAIVEASSASVNREFYGNLHNLAHNIIAGIHDPGEKYRENSGIMAYAETAARDPIFYRWHKFIDNIFHRHKSTLTPYTKDELLFQDINVTCVAVRAEEDNVIETFILEDQVDISHAPYLKTGSKISVKYERLDHSDFKYDIMINNNTGHIKPTTIRIFLGPKYDEFGKPLQLNEQRRLMIEMDKFRTDLEVGPNTITRKAIDSSVTLPRTKYTFNDLKFRNYTPTYNYCSCGWPHSLLLPRGTAKGMDFMLFVMCTDYEDDNPSADTITLKCNDAISYCGAKDQKYPDNKPMGYPFDRIIKHRTHEEWETWMWQENIENMIFSDLKIKFTGFHSPEMN